MITALAFVMTPLAAILIFVLMFVFFIGGKNLRTVLLGNLKKTPILLMYTKGKQAMLVTGREAGGTLDTKRGPFILNPNALTNFGSTTIGIAYEEVGHTPTPEFVNATADLKEEGIKDYDEAMELEDVLSGIKHEEEQKENPDKEVVGRLNKTLNNIYYIKDYFKYALNPSHINEKIANELQERMGEQKTRLLMWGMIIIGIIMAGAIAYVIISQMSGAACNYEPYRQALEMCQQQSSRVIGGNQSII